MKHHALVAMAVALAAFLIVCWFFTAQYPESAFALFISLLVITGVIYSRDCGAFPVAAGCLTIGFIALAAGLAAIERVDHFPLALIVNVIACIAGVILTITERGKRTN